MILNKFTNDSEELEEALAIYESNLDVPPPKVEKEEEEKSNLDTSMVDIAAAQRYRDKEFLSTLAPAALPFLS